MPLRSCVFAIKGNSLDDGPGIRSVVFFKGCPLSCAWCHNPEGMRPGPELAWDEEACVTGCTRCLEACPEGAILVQDGPPGPVRRAGTGVPGRWPGTMLSSRPPGPVLNVSARFRERLTSFRNRVTGRTKSRSRSASAGIVQKEEQGRHVGKQAPRVLVDRARCTRCGLCADACPSGALSRVGQEMTAGDILAAILPDRPFFDRSGGGVTLSGGEPTSQMNSAGELARRLKRAGIHVLLETCGLFRLEAFDRVLYPHLDLVYFDIKLMDTGKHERWCGTGNKTILRNFVEIYQRACTGGVAVLPRVPLVPGITDTEENLSAIATFLRDNGVAQVVLMPYNPLWPAKRRRLGMPPPAGWVPPSHWMTRDRMAACRSHFHGIQVDE